MKIQRIEIQNFRGFDHFTGDLTDPCLIVGNKGSGKTSLMEALAIAAGSLFLGFDDISSRNIHKEDVRRIGNEPGKVPTSQYPVEICCQGIVNGQEIDWKRTIEKENSRTTMKDAKKIQTIGQQIQKQSSAGKEILLPIVAYYSADRFWPNKLLKQVTIDKPGSRSKGYVNWLNPPANTTKLWNWLSWMEFSARDKGKPLAIFIAVKKAIADCSDNVQEVTYDFNENELLFQTRDRGMQTFWMLNDGDRNLVGMVADIAYRCVNLNPQFNAEAIEQTPGVVLIDDLELRLDSALEKNIMNKLRQIFPMIQFIGTTQSPLITEGIEPKKIVKLP